MANPITCLSLTSESIRKAYSVLKPHIHRTPLLTCSTLENVAATASNPGDPAPRIRLFFKCENYQKIGAFKARGAFYTVKHLVQELGLEEVQRRGVVTHSSGNHAQALALAAHTIDIPAYIVMPTISTPSKINGTRKYTDHVIFSGSTSQEREEKVKEVVKETGAILVPPYDHPDIILGQGSVGLELEEQFEELERARKQNLHGIAGTTSNITKTGVGTDVSWPATAPRRLNAVVAPIGGGGLLGGIATYFSRPSNTCEETDDKTFVFGAEPSFQGADDARRGLAMGKRIDTVKSLTIADGLRTPVGILNWKIVSDGRKVEAVYAVSEAEIKDAMRFVIERMKVVVEPSACVGLAMVLFNQEFRRWIAKKQEEEGKINGGVIRPWDVGVVFSGGNTTVEAIAHLFGGQENPIKREDTGIRSE